MHLLRRQFGNKFTDMIQASPTLMADLATIRRRGVKIRRIKGRTAYSYKKGKKIYIGTGWSRVMQVECLAHEIYHVLYGTSPEAGGKKVRRSTFIRESLDEETDCVIHELTVARELMDAGFKVDRCTEQWYQKYRNSGRRFIRKVLARTLTSIGNETYREYFEREYEELIGKH